MTARERFAPRQARGEWQGVRTDEGVDLLTGLPVLVHRFRGSPRPGAARLESPHLPGVLAAENDDEGGLLVTAISGDYRPLPEGASLSPEDARALLVALRDAERAGVPHGHLRADHLWRGHDGHLLVTGFGVPWGPGASADDDRVAAARLLLQRGEGLPEALTEALRATLDRPHATSAQALLDTLPAPDARKDGHAPLEAEPEPLEVYDDPAPAAAPKTSDFIKDLPPGGAYRSGNVDERVRPGAFDVLADDPSPKRPPWRLATLLALLVITALAAATVSLWGERVGVEPLADPDGAQGYVVDVQVQPASAPPLQLVVVDSPGGSSLTPGTVLGTAPRRVLVDREGRWVVQGRVGNERSAPVTFDVPDARAVTLRWSEDADGDS